MKKRSYKMLFRFFSYMSDRTNGASFFVEYKLLLGTLLIGLTGVSCKADKQKEAKAIPANSGLMQTTRRNVRDSIKKDSIQLETIELLSTVGIIDEHPKEFISCYLPASPPLPPKPEESIAPATDYTVISMDTISTVLPQDEPQD